MGPTTNKIHWDSKDNLNHKAYISTTRQVLPSYKPNLAKSAYRRITNIDLHRYFGFRMLQNINHFRQIVHLQVPS